MTTVCQQELDGNGHSLLTYIAALVCHLFPSASSSRNFTKMTLKSAAILAPSHLGNMENQLQPILSAFMWSPFCSTTVMCLWVKQCWSVWEWVAHVAACEHSKGVHIQSCYYIVVRIQNHCCILFSDSNCCVLSCILYCFGGQGSTWAIWPVHVDLAVLWMGSTAT